MTQEELDKLPDETPGFGVRIERIDGLDVRVPYQTGGFVGVLWNGEDDPVSVVDVHGDMWMLGWIGNRQVKRRAR